ASTAIAATLDELRVGGGGVGVGADQTGASLTRGSYRLARAAASAPTGAATVRLRRAAGLMSSGSTSWPTAVARISRSTCESGSIVTVHEHAISVCSYRRSKPSSELAIA